MKTDSSLDKIKELETVLREARDRDYPGMIFQDFVDWVRNNHGPMRATAISYNELVYHYQTSWS